MKANWQYKLLIPLFIVVVSALHYTADTFNPAIHGFYRLLYYIPIILAGFFYGFRGGVVVSLIVSLIYSPFSVLKLGNFDVQAVNEFLDVILFFTVGIITGTLVEKKNISLKRLDMELKRYVLLENYTNSIIESIRSGVIAVNNDMLITMINQGAREILQLEGELIGLNFTEVFTCCESVKRQIEKAIEEDYPGEVVEFAVDNGQRSQIVRISLFPLTSEHVKKGLVIIIDDITEVKKLQSQLVRNEKLAALGELSTGIAHEIRNPLGIIKAIEQTMRNELKDNPEAVKELEMIDEEVERANQVVKSLLDFGRLERREKVWISVHGLLDEVLSITNKYITQHQVRVEFLIGEDVRVFVNKEQWKQALVNIIFNAIQAMPNGGQLTVRAAYQPGFGKSHDTVKIVFVDTGVGISPEHLEKIFNPFFTTKDEGTGLGLSIVHRIVEEHGGWIHVTSSVGVGTKFEISLPVKGDRLCEKDSGC